ncbi:hypothetical protein NXC24_PB00031 (plasmid) [Rhizobium sp. NXC24]|nr:hypothetical protein NXC24_PB00031 [Rhizobium sp. NXC24]
MIQNEASIVNYCQRYWSGLPILAHLLKVLPTASSMPACTKSVRCVGRRLALIAFFKSEPPLRMVDLSRQNLAA